MPNSNGMQRSVALDSDLLIDEENRLFKTPFSPLYWKLAFKELTKLRVLVLAAVIIAIRVVISFIAIPVGDALSVTFGFFFNALGSMIYGPVVALISGAASDIIGFFVKPTGYPFFFGYTLNAMLSSLFFALLLYRTRITVWRCLVSRSMINIIVNIALGSLWRYMMGSKAYLAYISSSYFKNIALLPIEVFLLVLFINALLPFLAKEKLIVPQDRIKIKKTDVIAVVTSTLIFALVIGYYIFTKLTAAAG